MVYMYIQMCFDVFMYLRDFSRFFHFFFLKTNYADPVSVCVVLYVIILIQILIRYNIKNLITACTKSLDFDLKIEKKSPYPGRGDRPSPRSVASLPRICHFFTRCPPPPPQCVDPRYATVQMYFETWKYMFLRRSLASLVPARI